MALNVTTQNLQALLQQIAQAQGKAVHDYVQSQGFATEAELQAKINDVLGKIDAITKIDDSDGVETLAEKIQAIQDLLNNEEGAVQEILDRLTSNEKAISDLGTKVDSNYKLISDAIANIKNSVAKNASDISDVKTQVSNIEAEIQDKFSGIDSRVSAAEKAIETLNGDETVEGSVSYEVAKEAARAKAAEAGLSQAIETAKTDAINEAVSQSKTYTDQKVKDAIDNLDVASDSDFQALEQRVTKVESVLNDTTDENGELQKGIVTRVSDVETALTNEKTARETGDAQTLESAKTYTDSKSVQADQIDVNVIVNVFVDALQGTDTSSTDSSTTSSDSSSDGSAL